MESFIKKNRLYSVERLYGLSKESLSSYKSCEDILSVKYVEYDSTGFKHVYCQKSATALSDLSLDESAIKASFKKNVRYEISRAEKEKTRVLFLDCGHQDNNMLFDLKKKYELFCKEKGFSGSFDYDEASQFMRKGKLFISEAIADDCTVYHMYKCYDDVAILWYSFTEHLETFDRNRLGRNNKLLHYRDMLKLKEDGYKKLDWGGIRDINNPNGIDDFKMAFGSKPIETYNIYIGKSLKGLIMIIGLKIKEGRRRNEPNQETDH